MIRAQDLPTLTRHEEHDWKNVDCVFCCLPHATTQEIISQLPEHLKARGQSKGVDGGDRLSGYVICCSDVRLALACYVGEPFASHARPLGITGPAPFISRNSKTAAGSAGKNSWKGGYAVFICTFNFLQ